MIGVGETGVAQIGVGVPADTGGIQVGLLFDTSAIQVAQTTCEAPFNLPIPPEPLPDDAGVFFACAALPALSADLDAVMGSFDIEVLAPGDHTVTFLVGDLLRGTQFTVSGSANEFAEVGPLLMISTSANLVPVPDPNGPYEVDEGSTIILDGSGSSDADGTVESYAWDLDGDQVFGETGVDASKGDETGVSPTFDASTLDGDSTVVVSLKVTDDDGTESEAATTEVTVNNVAPEVAAVGDAIDEGGVATVDVTISDPGSSDTHTATIDWGDDSGVEDLGPVTSPLSRTHIYTDNGDYPITVTVTDDDGGVGVGETMVTVNNVAPTATLTNDGPVDEGTTANVSFSAQTDPSLDDSATGFVYDFDFGNDGTFEIVDSASPTAGVPSELAVDGPATVEVLGRIKDKDGGSTDHVTAVVVANVSPSLTCSIDPVNVGTTSTLICEFSDPGLDSHSVNIDWGDGATLDNLDPGSSPLVLEHLYTSDGNFTVAVEVTDDDGDTATDDPVAVVNPGICLFDQDGSGFIEQSEAVGPVADYLLERSSITREQAVEVATAYLLGTALTCGA